MGYSNLTRSRDVRMRGLAASAGVAVGHALRLDERGRYQFYYVGIPASQTRSEVKRLREAFKKARAELQDIKERLARELGHEHSYILDAHLLMLDDGQLIAEIEAEIRHRHINAEWAVRAVTDPLIQACRQISDSYLRERASDIEDIATRLLKILSGRARMDISRMAQDMIIVAEDIWPSTVAELDFNRVLGFATDAGGMTGHSAIIARAIGVPAVVGLREVTRRVKTGDTLALDGLTGEVVLRPTKPVMRSCLEKRKQYAKRRAKGESQTALAAETLDGARITLRANVELPTEIDSLSRFGAEGIGLYRSEYMFLHRLPELPSEEEQFQLYIKLAQATGKNGASIRVFDLGGDKLTLEGFKEEANPALGLRAIRLSLKVEEIFRTQIRAILRAAAHGKLRVVLPLISTIDEFRAARKIIDEVKADLAASRTPHDERLPVGVMIEIPAAALMADLFAREADFLSVGTNDLVQYMLAVDRVNENVAHLYQPLHPAVLRVVGRLVSVAEAEQVPLEVCGEMAADPLHAIALIGLGIRSLSLAPASIPMVKSAIRSVEFSRVRELMEEARKLSSAREVEALLAREFPSHAPRFFAARQK
jgi:phosphotransferase system enzyme I (PtsI)